MSGVLVWTFVLLAGVAVAEPLGSIASLEQFPSIAQVEVNRQDIWVQQCVASVITNYHVLTTASCFTETSPETVRIRVGTSYRGVGGQVRPVLSIELHPYFGQLDTEADIAVVRLYQNIELGDDVQRALILGEGIELPYGLLLNTAGWGTTAEGGEESNDDLYSLGLYVHQNEACLTKYFDLNKIVTENHVCVGLGYTLGRDFDAQDLGAPLFYEDTLVGILAYGQVADDELPIIATSVGSYSQWIVDTAV